MPDGAAVCPVLQFEISRTLLAVGGSLLAGYMGTGGEWHLLCRNVHPYPQSRADAALTLAADLHSSSNSHGDGHKQRAYGRFFTREPNQVSGSVLCGIYHGLFSAV